MAALHQASMSAASWTCECLKIIQFSKGKLGSFTALWSEGLRKNKVFFTYVPLRIHNLVSEIFRKHLTALHSLSYQNKQNILIKCQTSDNRILTKHIKSHWLTLLKYANIGTAEEYCACAI